MHVGSDQGPQGADGSSGPAGERGPKVNYSKHITIMEMFHFDHFLNVTFIDTTNRVYLDYLEKQAPRDEMDNRLVPFAVNQSKLLRFDLIKNLKTSKD